MKEWEAKVLGFTSAWWLLVLPLMVGSLAFVALPLGVMFALIALNGNESIVVHHVARWFLLGVASMLATSVLAACVYALLTLVVSRLLAY